MRLVSALAIASGLLLAAAPTVLAAPGRADTFYTFNCIDPDGNLDHRGVRGRARDRAGRQVDGERPLGERPPRLRVLGRGPVQQLVLAHIGGRAARATVRPDARSEYGWGVAPAKAVVDHGPKEAWRYADPGGCLHEYRDGQWLAARSRPPPGSARARTAARVEPCHVAGDGGSRADHAWHARPRTR